MERKIHKKLNFFDLQEQLKDKEYITVNSTDFFDYPKTFEDGKLLVIDFTDEFTKVLINDKYVDINELFEEKCILSEYRKMLIKFTFGLGNLYEASEMIMTEPFDLTGRGMEKIDNNECLIKIKNIKENNETNQIIIATKVKQEKYKDALKLYEGLEKSNQFADYCEILNDMFYRAKDYKKLRRIDSYENKRI